MNKKMYKLVRNTHDYLEDIPPNEDNIYFEYEDIKRCADSLLVSTEDIMNDFVKTSWRETNHTKYIKEKKKLEYLINNNPTYDNEGIERTEISREYYTENIYFNYDFGRSSIYFIAPYYYYDDEIENTLGEFLDCINEICNYYSYDVDLDIRSTRSIQAGNYSICGKLCKLRCVFYNYEDNVYVATEKPLPWINKDEYKIRNKELIKKYSEDTLLWHDVLYNNNNVFTM